MIHCVLAESGLSVHNGGHVSVCNGSRQMFTTGNNTITLDRHTLEEAWHSPTRLEIKQALANNIQHENCTDCWIKEAAGFPSMRQIHNKNLQGLVPLENQPRVLILKPGNVCNLGCRHCDAQVSSGWYRDDHAVNFHNISYQEYLERFRVTRNSYADDNPNWTIIRNWAKNIVHWDLYGAEPLLINPLLDSLRSADSDSTIHINTNGTIWRDEFVELFKKFRSVNLDISVDGINEQFNYLRYPAEFNQVHENIKRYHQIGLNIHISVTVTVSIYNVLYLDQIHNLFGSLGINCSFNLLHNPESMNIRALPDSAKLAVKAHLLEKFDNPLKRSIIDFMKLPLDNRDFFQVTKQIDQIRNQSFQDIFPEMYELIKEYE